MTGPVHLILYVQDQEAATAFWRAALGSPPALNVPGMTEFALGAGIVLGLMPEAGISALLGPALPDPAGGRGVPRAEIYLVVDDPAACHARALAAGARCRRWPAGPGETTRRTAWIQTVTSWLSPAGPPGQQWQLSGLGKPCPRRPDHPTATPATRAILHNLGEQGKEVPTRQRTPTLGRCRETGSTV